MGHNVPVGASSARRAPPQPAGQPGSGDSAVQPAGRLFRGRPVNSGRHFLPRFFFVFSLLLLFFLRTRRGVRVPYLGWLVPRAKLVRLVMALFCIDEMAPKQAKK